MRQHKILTRTLLILSIINVALAAPARIRQRLEVRPDANTSNVTASLQKRWIPEDGSTNVPGPDHASADSPIWSQIVQIAQENAEQYGYSDSPLHSPDNSGSETGPGNVPLNPGWPTGPRLPEGSIPMASTLPPPASPGQPDPSDDRFPPGFYPSGLSVNPGKLSSTGNQPKQPQTAAQDLVTPPAPSPETLPDEFWDKLLKGQVTPPPLSPEPLPDEFWDKLSKGPDTPPPLSPEPLPEEFWDELSKSGIKRRNSGSEVQRDPRSTNISST